MMMVRLIFQAKYGKGADLLDLFKDAHRRWSGVYTGRILAERDGAYVTVISETEVASFEEWERRLARIFAQPDFAIWFLRMTHLVDSNRRELYTVETMPAASYGEPLEPLAGATSPEPASTSTPTHPLDEPPTLPWNRRDFDIWFSDGMATPVLPRDADTPEGGE